MLKQRLPDAVKKDLAQHSWDLPKWAKPIAWSLDSSQTAAA